MPSIPFLYCLHLVLTDVTMQGVLTSYQCRGPLVSKVIPGQSRQSFPQENARPGLSLRSWPAPECDLPCNPSDENALHMNIKAA